MSGFLSSAKNYVTDKIANIKKPEAELKDVDLSDVSRDSVTLKGKISVNNPYDRSIPICEISFVLKSGGRVIVSGTIPDPGCLAAGLTHLDVPVKVPYSILFSLAKDIGADWDIDYEMEVGLIIDLPIVGNITLPLSQKGEFKLPTFSDFFK
ncbi:hypothetical protein IFM89_017981 [Coptis chinensis]|uniref:Water stress and hypersensitive response domain-containing protein n=1 Tax=Coptis chinensis TaxID=261450 RepID=A0A835HYF4_9MAGN|nr:hypothetical protein IFM89_017981 [Coptis chinensis]